MILTAYILIYQTGQEIPGYLALDTPETSGPPKTFIVGALGWMELPATGMESGPIGLSEDLRHPSRWTPSGFQVSNCLIHTQFFHVLPPLWNIIEKEHRHWARIFRRLSDTCSIALRQFSVLSGEFALTFMNAPWS